MRATNALPNSSLFYNIYNIDSPSLAMAAVRRRCVPSDDLDSKAYQRDYNKAQMKEGGDSTI